MMSWGLAFSHLLKEVFVTGRGGSGPGPSHCAVAPPGGLQEHGILISPS